MTTHQGVSILKRIDALLQRANRLEGQLKPSVSFLSWTDGLYSLECAVWDGKPQGRTKIQTTIHETRGAAMEAYEAHLARFKADQKAAAVLIDLSDLQQGGE